MKKGKIVGIVLFILIALFFWILWISTRIHNGLWEQIVDKLDKVHMTQIENTIKEVIKNGEFETLTTEMRTEGISGELHSEFLSMYNTIDFDNGPYISSYMECPAENVDKLLGKYIVYDRNANGVSNKNTMQKLEIICEVYKIQNVSTDFLMAVKFEENMNSSNNSLGKKAENEKYVYFRKKDYMPDKLETFMQDSGLHEDGVVDYVWLSSHGLLKKTDVYICDDVEMQVWEYLSGITGTEEFDYADSETVVVRIYITNKRLDMTYTCTVKADGRIEVFNIEQIASPDCLFGGTEEQAIFFLEQLKGKSGFIKVE